jgi:hypothetical protein
LYILIVGILNEVRLIILEAVSLGLYVHILIIHIVLLLHVCKFDFLSRGIVTVHNVWLLKALKSSISEIGVRGSDGILLLLR